MADIRKQAGWRIEVWIIDKVNELSKIRDDTPRKVVETALKEHFKKSNLLDNDNKMVTNDNKIVTDKNNSLDDEVVADNKIFENLIKG